MKLFDEVADWRQSRPLSAEALRALRAASRSRFGIGGTGRTFSTAAIAELLSMHLLASEPEHAALRRRDRRYGGFVITPQGREFLRGR